MNVKELHAVAEQLFGKPFRWEHKTVFTLLSWLLFGVLLAGRQYYVNGYRFFLPEAPATAHGLKPSLIGERAADEGHVRAMLPIHAESGNLSLGAKHTNLAVTESHQIRRL